MKKILHVFAAFCILAFATGVLTAQEDDDEEKRFEGGRKYAHAFQLYSLAKIKSDLFKFGALSSRIYEGPHGASALEFRIRSRLKSSLIPATFLFSFYVDTRAYGSPGLDEVVRPRLSLNIDPVTGWYYWDF